MKAVSFSTLSFILPLIINIIIFSSSPPASAHGHHDFLECLFQKFENNSSISTSVYSKSNSSYSSILQFSIRNLRFALESTPKPQVIITPEHESEIPPLIHCAKESDLEIRTRSGGHDFEGLSYVSRVPFVIIDLINLSEVTVDVEAKTAWIEAGATLGSVYYRIAEKSRILGFPAGSCPTVGVGGHFSGGGYGPMFRKYGLAADNVIDARIIDANSRILDRKSMGEDLFWAIRGGGGASFGVIIAWKVQLVDVPNTVTVFTVDRTLEQNATRVLLRWQEVAHQLDKDLFIAVVLSKVNKTIRARFYSLFLGGVDRLVPLMQGDFPELGIKREDCSEMSWIESIRHFSETPVIPPVELQPLEFLLNRTPPVVENMKVKSDYVQSPIPELGLQGIFRLLFEPEAEQCLVYMIPYGGRMAEISESDIPFPHRAGNLFKVFMSMNWQGNESERYIRFSRRYYSYMAPYVSRFPRGAYLNDRDLDIGVNNPDGETSYAQASIWGFKYFKNNFDRLVRIKTVVDPDNFFKNEQSIPPWHSSETLHVI